MPVSALVLRFRPEVRPEEAEGGEMWLHAPWGTAALGPLAAGLGTALRTLAGDGATAEALADQLAATGDASALAWLYHALERWGSQGMLSYTLSGPDGAVATVVPATRDFRPCPADLAPESCFRLARFAYVRQEGDRLALASPSATARVLLSAPIGAAFLTALMQPATVRAFIIAGGLPEETVTELFGLLAQAGLIELAPDSAAPPEAEDVALVQWEFHDLLFHRHSRLGRHGGAIGGTFPFAGTIPPLPAVKPPSGEPPIPLERPSIEHLERTDRSLTWALERRRSQRAYGEAPITAAQLGEFLYRVARIRAVIPAVEGQRTSYEASDRPYPSGGATYDLELYPAIQSCTGLDGGLYHYDPLAHTLEPLAARPAQVRALLRDATRAAPLSSPPQVLIVLTSRFQRLSWKYRSFAYAAALKHVGVLYQSMYLVATAMGLAPCALGTGDAELFSAAAGTDYFAESSVGEFLLGSAAAGSS
jgi:SagB-type dehydrogenase family enzyme